MTALLLVALGGAIGSVARFGVNIGAARLLGSGLPWGTFAVNVVGSLVMGFLAGYLVRKLPDAEPLRLFTLTGVLGGFTTFSAFSLDVANLMQRGENAWALAYAVASVVLSVAGVFAGLMLAKAIAA